MLSPHVPRAGHDPYVEFSHPPFVSTVAEGDEPRRHLLGHVPRELERVAFRTADNTLTTEERRNEMHDAHDIAHGLLTRSSRSLGDRDAAHPHAFNHEPSIVGFAKARRAPSMMM